MRFLRYALGEIVLVVAGILIALQVNDWNEQRKEECRALEAEALEKKDQVQQLRTSCRPSSAGSRRWAPSPVCSRDDQ